MKNTCLPALALLFSLPVMANVSLPKIFGDNMVLQRDHAIPVWGWATPNEKINVQFHQQTKTIKADKKGYWKVNLDAEQAGGPYQLTVSGKNTITFKEVLLGDVWICSGQSNMEFHLSSSINAAKEIQSANYPQIRHFKVPLTVATLPKQDINGGSWQVCSPETAGDFTAVGYFFARELYNELKVPIGLLNTSWGGTHSETWTSKTAFENSDEFKEMIKGMPSLNMDSLAAITKAAVAKRIQTLQGAVDPAAVSATYNQPDFNDANWPQMQLPGLWEQQQIGELDGKVWFRKTVTITASDAGKPAVLELAMIDDNDTTFINGVKVGSTVGYNVKRKYNVPAGVLKEGKNVIAVLVIDNAGGGGIYGDKDDVKLTIGSTGIPLAGAWGFKVAEIFETASALNPNKYPTLLFNAMVNPLIPYAIKGVIWYQGESNAGRAYQYRKAFPLMITDWRKHWNQGDFPFYFVQLASFNANNGASGNSQNGGSYWAELREAQTLTLALPNTGMSITTDIGEGNDIHPKNKQDVGKRLAAIALHDVYTKDNVRGGPVYQSMKADGKKVTLLFTQTGGGLMAKDKYGYLKGFEVAGADQKFHYAKAWLEGSNVMVSSDSVDAPVAVRFAWADNPEDANLYNREGFPAQPFRTDDWKAISTANVFKIE